MKKIIWNDIEASGTDPKVHAILQIAAAIEEDGVIVDTFESKMAPYPGKIIDPKALEVNGFKMDEIYKFPAPEAVYAKFRMFCHKHGNQGVKEDRFIPAGYNNQFDLDFLMQWHTEMESKYAFWDYLQFSPIDPLPTLRAFRLAGILPIADTKLQTCCTHFGIEINAHDAMSDVLATRELTTKLYSRIFTDWMKKPWGLLGELPELYKIDEPELVIEIGAP
jgi:DNA polymerase III epsilon subunit-like protein